MEMAKSSMPGEVLHSQGAPSLFSLLPVSPLAVCSAALRWLGGAATCPQLWVGFGCLEP